jgi:glyoxylase-like metal-dependent hydrolase (beta-lactamase superfamily II)
MSSERITYGSVEGLRTGRYGLGLNAKAVCYRIGRTLVDTGPPNQWRAVRRFATEQAEAHGIDRVLLTHHHEDHAGNAARLQELLDVPVYAPEAALDRLRDGVSVDTYRWIVWGRPRPVEAEPVPDTLSLVDGTTLRTLPAPGHTDDMVCYLAEEHGLLFAADLYVTRRPQYLRAEEHAPRLIESIHDVLEHDFHTLLGGHRGVVEDGRRALAEKVKYLEALCGVVQRRYRYDKLAVPEITDEILGREGMLYWVSGGDFSKHNLIASCLDSVERSAGQIVTKAP